MNQTRRDFIHASLAAGVAMGFAPAVRSQAPAAGPAPAAPPERAARALRILVLGGTRFLGPGIVDAALARGHTVTLFNRGKSDPGIYSHLETLLGDRDPLKGDGLRALEGARAWDAVADTSGYFPRMVRGSAELLADRVKQYVFISTISVYSDNGIVGMDESGPIATMEDETIEVFGDQFQYYGPAKALCEKAAEAAMPGRVTIIRPGLIVGPRDNAPRFAYWPLRVRRGGEVLAPGAPDDPVQFIDARDLGAFVVKAIEDGTTGAFNANGPAAGVMNMAELVYGCKAVTGGDARFTWVDADFLAAQGLGPWSDLPVWMPPRGETAGFHRVDCSKAVKAGLTTRPLAQTVQATLEWYGTGKARDAWGVKPEREAEVLAAWHAHQGGQARG